MKTIKSCATLKGTMFCQTKYLIDRVEVPVVWTFYIPISGPNYQLIKGNQFYWGTCISLALLMPVKQKTIKNVASVCAN